MKARIVLEAENREEAKAIADALNPDNSLVPKGMKISTKVRGSHVIAEIRSTGRIQTLTSTIDDLLRCAQTAERTLRSIPNT